MLLYAWDLAVFADRYDAQLDEASSLLGLLAQILHDSTKPLIARGLGRQFQQHTQAVEGVRGRIDLMGTLKLQSRQASRTHCTFNQLTIDTPRNRLLKATMARLVADPRLGSHGSAKKANQLRTDLRNLVHRMSGVSLAPVDASVLSCIQLGRNDQAYKLPLKICELLHRMQLPTENEGDHAWTALLRDEIRFSSLFERFSRNYLRQKFQDWDVASRRLTWPAEEGGSLLMPTMQTDISLTHKNTGQRIVVDTKYYQQTLSKHHYGSERFHRTHLSQIYTYLRTQEERSDQHRCATGVLLYPKVSKMLDERTVIQGHLMRVMTVDLMAPWSEIEKQMSSVVNGDQ